jgi:hypothetical protein
MLFSKHRSRKQLDARQTGFMVMGTYQDIQQEVKVMDSKFLEQACATAATNQKNIELESQV